MADQTVAEGLAAAKAVIEEAIPLILAEGTRCYHCEPLRNGFQAKLDRANAALAAISQLQKQ